MRKAAWKPTGDGSSVGLFIPLPANLAAQFPSLVPHDDSPPHITLLYVGKVPKARESLFVDTLQKALQKEPGPIRASLDGVDHFVHTQQDRQVFFSRVRFSRDVAELRDRVWLALESAGFEVKHSFPLAFFPHVTLGYFSGATQKRVWRGVTPHGSWDFNSIAVWGLSKPVQVSLGAYTAARFSDTWNTAPQRVASRWIDQVPGGLGDKKVPSDFDPQQIAKGQKVEMEHTTDPLVALEIAVDHLTEDPLYYDKLEKIEKHARFR